MTDRFFEIYKLICQMNEELLQVYTPMVDEMCSRSDILPHELEHLLDDLLSVCINDDMLILFKKVCRRFYQAYPEIVAKYIMLYKELYEDVE